VSADDPTDSPLPPAAATEETSSGPAAETSSGPAAGTSSAPSYAAAGVDLDHDEGFIDDIKEIARPTHRAELLAGVGGFAGLFKAPDRYKEPVFVASADGVGTKLRLAAQIGRFDTVGIDCVAMVVNDLIVQGAEPLIFLDYLAMDRLDRTVAKQALRGIAEGCRRAGCALLGGETATMPGVYQKGDLEMVGFGVGVVERDKLIDGSSISQGDVILGLASSGIHSNGYSLVRRILERSRPDLAAPFDARAGATPLGDALMAPTRIYVKPLLALLRALPVKGMAHITGGGLTENVPRVLPKGVAARLEVAKWPRPPVFDWLQREGSVADAEMHRVFNCGIGMVVIVAPEHADRATLLLTAAGESVHRIGGIVPRAAGAPAAIVQ
jgi:phosphoribosylformylglycinamidine cyclo-ligase